MDSYLSFRRLSALIIPRSIPEMTNLTTNVIRFGTNESGGSQIARFCGALHRSMVQPRPLRCGRLLFSGSLTVNSGTPAVGRSAITEVAHWFMTSFPDMRVVMDKLLVQDNRTEYHWTLRGTNTGPGGTGRQVRISGFELWRIGADGLIAASEGHFDASEYQRQLDHGSQDLG